MAYVRTRTTKAGALSTTLVEAYRDENGRPRQRVIANLHGEPDTLRALAKLVVLHDLLLERREEEHAEPSSTGAGFVLIPDRALTKHNRSIAQIDRQVRAMERDVEAILKHCTPSDDELLAAMQRFRKEYCEAFERVLGLGFLRKQADAALRRKSG